MKKILISCLIVLLLGLASLSIYSGISILNTRVFGIGEIKDSNEDLDNTIKQASDLAKIEMPAKLKELNTESAKLTITKEEYESLVVSSTIEDSLLAGTAETYEIDFLWVKLGNYAKKEGLAIVMELTTNSNGVADLQDLKFTLTGGYVGITDFLYDIENDSKLNMKIENFSLQPSSGTDILVATFIVKDLSIAY